MCNSELLSKRDSELVIESIHEKIDALKNDFHNCSSHLTDEQLNKEIDEYKSIVKKLQK